MRSINWQYVFAILVSGMVLGGCAHNSIVPVTTLEGRTCSDKLDLSSPKKLSLSTKDPLIADLGADSLCIKGENNSQSTYLVFRLPDYSAPYYVDVESIVLDKTLFAPRVFVLDESGQLRRTIPKDDFLFRGGAIKASIFENAADAQYDRYLVVASAPEAVGTSDSRVVSGPGDVYITPGAGAGFMFYMASEGVSGYTYTYNGRLRLSANLVSPVVNAH